MRRRVLVVLLALGTIGGYTSGFASLRYRSHCRRAWMEERAYQNPRCAPCPTTAEAPTPSGPR